MEEWLPSEFSHQYPFQFFINFEQKYLRRYNPFSLTKNEISFYLKFDFLLPTRANICRLTSSLALKQRFLFASNIIAFKLLLLIPWKIQRWVKNIFSRQQTSWSRCHKQILCCILETSILFSEVRATSIDGALFTCEMKACISPIVKKFGYCPLWTETFV